MKGEPLAAARRRSLRSARGRILEIGIGTGQNLPHYPQAVTSIAATDPNPGMERELHKRLAGSAVSVNFQSAPAESLPFADATFETVVSTQVLCSVKDPVAALREARRVLAPGGRLLFLEHGHSDDPKVARWQRWLTPLQRLFAAGCRLDVPVLDMLHRAGFEVVDLHRYYMEGDPKTHGSMYEGIAIV
ncbi:MAG: methyltransferase domain-containing protein [Myxococcales bacterium]|nr:methyltransferase domain-containing protein [Myxococcales bacterium]